MPQAPRTRYCSRCLTTFPADLDRCPNLSCRTVRPQGGWGELLEPGELLDRTYRVLDRLAIGGAGVTYLGREVDHGGVEIGPKLALKVLYQQRDQGAYLRRLATEAQILQGLNHPNIVECRGFVHRTGHSPYLVTRFEEGGSLLDHIRRVGTLPIPVVANIGRQIAWALDVAHRQGVVHRDLKPENVLLVRPVPRETTPEVRVADFGIAKVYGGFGERLTRMGAFVGTPQYAAPEQFEGLAPEPATDIYALGALLYVCLMGRPVAEFIGELDPDDQRTLLLKSLPAKLDMPEAPRNLVRWMEATLAAAMAVDPGDRCDITALDRRLADIAAERDPGFVRLPPAPDPSGALLTNMTLSADVLAEAVNSTDEVQQPYPSLPPAAEPPDPSRRVPTPPPASDRVPPDPGAGTADPLGDPDRVSKPYRRPLRPPGEGTPLAAAEPPSAPDPSSSVLGAVPANAAAPAVPPAPVASGSASAASASAPSSAVSASMASAPSSPASSPAGAPAAPSAAPPGPAAAAPAPAALPSRPESPTLDRTTSNQGAGRPGRTKARGSVSGGLGCGFATLAGGAVGLLIIVIVVWFVKGGKGDEVQVLRGTEADAEAKAEWTALAMKLGEEGVKAEAICAAPPYLQVEITVDGHGRVQRADLLNWKVEPARVCVEKYLQGVVFPRTRKNTVKLAVSLTK